MKGALLTRLELNPEYGSLPNVISSGSEEFLVAVFKERHVFLAVLVRSESILAELVMLLVLNYKDLPIVSLHDAVYLHFYLFQFGLPLLLTCVRIIYIFS